MLDSRIYDLALSWDTGTINKLKKKFITKKKKE